MRRLILPAALALCAVLSARAFAQEPIPGPKPEPLPNPTPVELPPPCAGGCQHEKTISLPRALLVEEQEAITVPKMRLREQPVGRDVIHKMVVKYVEEKQYITEMKAVPRTVEQQVCTTKMVPETSVDPATGKACTIWTKVPDVRTVKLTVYDVVPVQREVVIRKPCITPVEQEVEIRKLVIDETDEAAILKRWNLIMTPNEIKVMLPACPLPCMP